jgi:hypothetical protein
MNGWGKSVIKVLPLPPIESDHCDLAAGSPGLIFIDLENAQIN